MTNVKTEIHVTHGVVTYHGFGTCTIKANGMEIKSMSGIIPGWHYGLIDYNCDGIRGQLVSKLTCRDCGIYCMDNDMIEGCGQALIPIVIGVLVGLIIGAATSVLWAKWIGPRLIKLAVMMTLRCRRWRAARRDARMLKLSHKLEQVANRKVVTQEPIAPIDTDDIDNNEDIPDPIVLDHRMYPSLVGLVVLGLLGSAVACDNTLFISSKGEICDTTTCYTTQMHEISISYGSQLCFRDINGNIMEMSIQTASDVFRSNLVYYTSEYELVTTSVSVCKGSVNDLCWNGSCHKSSKHKSLAINSTATYLHGYGCDTDSLGCDVMCWHKTSCTYYRWTVKRSDALYPVYKTVSKLWELDLSIKYKNVTKVYKFNVNNPRINLDHIDIVNMPVIVTSLSHQLNMYENHIIRIEDRFYNVDASHINMPETDKIGDLQVSTDKTEMIYNTHNVLCQVNSCRVACTIPSPKLSRMIKNTQGYLTLNTTYNMDATQLISRYNIAPTAKIMIGNIDINNLKVTPAYCDVNAYATFACKACTLSSYVVLAASNIKSEGIMPFSSNCSFDRTYLSCNPTYYKLALMDSNKICELYMPYTNKSIIVKFDYIYLGKLDASGALYSRSDPVDDVLSFMGNETLWSAISYTWVSLSLLTVIISLISRIIIRAAPIIPTVMVPNESNKE
uniref:GP n=1 Tax=Aedes phasmavirus TaxID=2778219 RepID=A0A7L9B138_9VIRU|nr:GP [Aedes phasmavirus]QOI91416.1 GP [Aedes phasmavirus]QOI91419.1 GP [Aedes phasmavirus]QOI91422.1 GP [Aedes phasmavirus]